MLRSFLIATTLLSCVQPAEDDLGSTEQSVGCPLGHCGGNSPLLGPKKIEELEETGIPNDDGVQLKGFIKPNTLCTTSRPCRVDVVADKVFAKAYQGTVYSGSALENGWFYVWQPGDTSIGLPAGYARIIINHVSGNSTRFWQQPLTFVETYDLSYDIPNVSRGPVCKNPPPEVDGEGNPWVSRFEATIFTGDRYKHDTKTVIASSYVEAGNWFNIGCAGSATAKLHLNRHTTAGTSTQVTTTRDQRQAMLKMYTGDFCGTGTTYTVQGTKIDWGSSTGLVGPAVTGINSFESLWTKDGALCMVRHRLASSQDPNEAALEGIIRDGYNHGTCPKMPRCDQLREYPDHYLKTSSAALP